MVQNTDGQQRPIQAIIGCDMLIMKDLRLTLNQLILGSSPSRGTPSQNEQLREPKGSLFWWVKIPQRCISGALFSDWKSTIQL
jgi:hypothetical protein